MFQDVEKGKGVVYYFEKQRLMKKEETRNYKDQKLISSAIQVGIAMSRLHVPDMMHSEGMAANFLDDISVSQSCSTVFRIAFS